MHLLTNPVRHYDWGSTEAIPRLLGAEPDGRPWAELWLGGHPDSPSTAEGLGRLDEAVAAEPDRLLGDAVRQRFGDRLPYLVKVLAAGGPLSLQVHPTEEQADQGFEEDEARGVPQDAPQRRYRDRHHKPEMVVALEPFEALCGLRPPSESLSALRRLDVGDEGWDQLLAVLGGDDPEQALGGAVALLLGGEGTEGLADAVVAAARAQPEAPGAALLSRLGAAYPGDPGVVVAALLHHVRLSPGEALFLPAGNIHAYLDGTGVEVMAASDNVLRAGLTSKHVDVPELLRVADFRPRPVPSVVPEVEGRVSRYRPPVAEFEVAVVAAARERGSADPEGEVELQLAGPRVVLCLQGRLELRAGGEQRTVQAGESVFVPADEQPLVLRGPGGAAVTGVPQPG